MPGKFYFAYLIVVVLSSCGGTTHHLSSGKLSGNRAYTINSYFGCCGCQAKYFFIDSGKRHVEQVIYSYNCYNTGKPTKFVFNYNDAGKITSCDRYVATTINDYMLKLTEQEKLLFTTLEADSTLKATHTTIRFSEITGFRKPVDQEVTHSFPLIKKGNKLVVNQ
jgi:hypothetical protein